VLAAALILLVAPVALVLVVAMLGDMLPVPRDRGPLLRRENRISRGQPFDRERAGFRLSARGLTPACLVRYVVESLFRSRFGC